MYRMIEEVEVGMGKSEVVEKLGSPNRTDRDPEMDKWIYTYDTDGDTGTSEIHFKKSKVIYVGPSVQDSLDNKMKDSDGYKEYKDSIEERRRRRSEKFEDL